VGFSGVDTGLRGHQVHHWGGDGGAHQGKEGDAAPRGEGEEQRR